MKHSQNIETGELHDLLLFTRETTNQASAAYCFCIASLLITIVAVLVVSAIFHASVVSSPSKTERFLPRTTGSPKRKSGIGEDGKADRGALHPSTTGTHEEDPQNVEQHAHRQTTSRPTAPAETTRGASNFYHSSAWGGSAQCIDSFGAPAEVRRSDTIDDVLTRETLTKAFSDSVATAPTSSHRREGRLATTDTAAAVSSLEGVTARTEVLPSCAQLHFTQTSKAEDVHVEESDGFDLGSFFADSPSCDHH